MKNQNGIILKSKAEIEKMRTAGKIAAELLDWISPKVVEGVSTEWLDAVLHDRMVKEYQVIPAPLNYKGFPKSVCISINHQVCHGIPSARLLKNGDIVNIDLTVIKDGWYGDTSRMFEVGAVSVAAKRLCQVTKACLDESLALIRPNVTLGDLGAYIQNKAESLGYSVVREYCGHGIGQSFHEPLQVLHYGRPGEGVVLQEGMTFTVEPMINIGKRQTKVLPDGWTVVTRDRSLSAQWEHTIAVTSQGCDILTL